MPHRINTKKNMSNMSTINLLEIKDKEKNLESSQRKRTYYIQGKNTKCCVLLIRNYGGQKGMNNIFKA